MAKIGLRQDRDYQQIGEAVLAAWFKILDPDSGVKKLDDLKPELAAIVREVLDAKTDLNIVIDSDKTTNIVIPYLPYDEKKPGYISTTDELIAYLRKYHEGTSGRHYGEELGQAVVFGCGR
jgi:hypothetical protein